MSHYTVYVTIRKHEFWKAEKHGLPENTVCVGTHYSHHPYSLGKKMGVLNVLLFQHNDSISLKRQKGGIG